MALTDILVAVGPGDAGSAAALAEPVIDIAEPAGATVTLLHVFDQEHFSELQANLPSGSERLDPDAVARRHATIRQIGQRLAAADVTYTPQGGVGEAANVVVETAQAIDADMVVVGGQGRSPAGKALFGSTAQAVLRHASPPVLFIKRGAREQSA
jgi:nucleotide-binding universal stress UspA family protein